jgi:DDE superfamily endonuclease
VRLVGGRSRRWSILPAIGINGYLDYDIYHGSFNTERFNNFIRHLLSKMEAYPGPRSVLVMDNHTCHHSIELKSMCEEAGVIIEYLPPYSPDYSPIEQSFHGMKSWMQRNQDLASTFGEWYEGFFTLAVINAVTPDQSRGYFRDAGFSVEEED